MLYLDTDKLVYMPTLLQTTAPEAMQTLEQVWRRRREQLGDWKPSGGWLLDQREPRHSLRTHAR